MHHLVEMQHLTRVEFLRGLQGVADEESLRQPVIALVPDLEQEVLGTLIVRNIFHCWSHIGEISAIRQMLGHPHPPQFVTMHGWQYGEGLPP